MTAKSTSIAIDEIIAGRERGSHEQPTHYRQVMTFFGVYARPAGKAIPVAAVVKLLVELNAEASSVRSSISRLKSRGVLVPRMTAAGTGYAIADNLEPHMKAGDERIFAPRATSVNDPWLLISFSVPERERHQRHRIRIGLNRLGFGTVGSALYIGPVRLRIEVEEYIREHGLWDYVELFTCQPSEHVDLRTKLARWWDLDALGKEYQDFVTPYQPEAIRWRNLVRDGAVDAEDAFRAYIPMLTQWRRLPYLDPGLPIEFLPDNWIGISARKVFSDLHRLLAPLASRHVAMATGQPD